MKELLKWIEKNSKEGVDLKEAQELVSSLQINIDSREKAADFIDQNSHVKAELDSRISKSVDNALERFKENKLPGMIEEEKEKIRKELNPEETPEQKKIRELEERLKLKDEKDMVEQKKAELRQKAKDIDFDPLKAERYHVYGEEAEKMLMEDVEFFNNSIKEKVDSVIKNKYGNRAPEGDSKPKTQRSEVEQAYQEAMKSGDVQKAFMLKEQLAKLPRDEMN